MIRELKSLKQLSSLILLEIEKDASHKMHYPELSASSEFDETGCNWKVSRWVGPGNRTVKATPQLVALITGMQRRYKAIVVRQPTLEHSA